MNTNIPKARAEQARVVAADPKRRVEALDQIEQLPSDARRKPTGKYAIPF